MSSNFLSLAEVNDDDDDDGDDDVMFAQRGPRGSGLGSLFVNAAAASSSSLKYQPPKAPVPAHGASASGDETEKASQKRPSSASAAAVDAFRFDKSAGSYKAEGKVGVALISSSSSSKSKGRGSGDQAQTLLVLYRSNRQKLALAAVGSTFRLDVQDNLYACFNDGRSGETWSVRFGTQSDLTAIAKGVAIAKVPPLLNNCTVVAQDVKLGQKESLPHVTCRCVVDFTYSGWLLDLENSCLGLKFDEGEKAGVTLGDVGILAGWKMGMLGMKESGERLIVVPPNLGYSKKDLPSNVPEGSTLAFLIRLYRVRPEVGHVESAGELSRGRVLVDRVVTKVGQPVLPIPRASTTKSESETSSIQTEASTTSANVASAETAASRLPASGTSINDLVLAESRLQNTELRMTLTRLDDKLERLTSLVTASSYSAQEEPNVALLKQENGVLKNENEKLRDDNSVLSHKNFALGDSNRVLGQENEDLKKKLSEVEEGLISANAKLERTEKADAALINAQVHKRVKKVMGKVYKRLQSDFAGDEMTHSGKEVRDRLANSIRETVSLLEESDGRSGASQGEAPVTTPVALVNPIPPNDASENHSEATNS